MLFLGDILMLPLSGFKFVLRTLQQVTEEQYTDNAPIKERLLELQLELESGEISEDEYAAEEAAIFRQLREIENRKREMAGVPVPQPGAQSFPQFGELVIESALPKNVDQVEDFESPDSGSQTAKLHGPEKNKKQGNRKRKK